MCAVAGKGAKVFRTATPPVLPLKVRQFPDAKRHSGQRACPWDGYTHARGSRGEAPCRPVLATRRSATKVKYSKRAQARTELKHQFIAAALRVLMGSQATSLRWDVSQYHRHMASGLLIGRDETVALLERQLGAAANSEGSGVLLVGEAGIGKTALAQTAMRLAEAASYRVLSCSGVRSGSLTGFGGLHELLRPILGGVAALPPRQRSALNVVLGIEQGEGVDQLLLGLAVLGLIEEAAQAGPLLILIEDMHWLDPSSADIISLLPHRLTGTRAFVLATTRPVAEGAGREDGFRKVVTLPPLDAEEASTLLDAQAPSLNPTVQARILRQSLGNPLALLELSDQHATAAEFDDPVPVTARIEQVFLAEARQLPVITQRAMLFAAAGDDAPAAEVLSAIQLAGMELDDLAAAERARLVRLSGNRFIFRHPLIASALYEAADFATRADVHRTLAEAATDQARRTRHRAAATVGWDEEVAAELDAAAASASRQGAKREAIAAWRRAAEMSPQASDRARRLVEAAEAARQGGNPTLCGHLLAEAAPLDQTPATKLRFARTEWVLSMTAVYQGRNAEQLLELAASFTDADARMEVLVWAAAKCYILQEPPALRTRVAAAVAATPSEAPEALREVASVLADPSQGFGSDALAQFRGEVDDTHGILLNCLAFCAEELNNFALAELCWTTGVDLFHSTGRVSDEVTAVCGRSTVRLNRGRIEAGIEDAELALRLATDLNLPIVAGMAGAALARGRALRGEHEDARTALALVAELPGAPSFARVAATAAWAAAIVAANTGDHGRAVDELGRAMEYGPVGLWAGGQLAGSAVQVGRADLLVRWLAMARPVAEATRAPSVQVLIDRVRALMEDGPLAEQYFRASIEAGRDQADASLHVARTRLLYGEWLRRERRIVEAREHLSGALDVFEALGLVILADRAREELRAAGIRAVPATSADANELRADDTLTSQELAVARLAAQGLSNKEIADQMYLSHRTVGSHLRHAFTKLGVSRRGQLSSVTGLRAVAS